MAYGPYKFPGYGGGRGGGGGRGFCKEAKLTVAAEVRGHRFNPRIAHWNLNFSSSFLPSPFLFSPSLFSLLSYSFFPLCFLCLFDQCFRTHCIFEWRGVWVVMLQVYNTWQRHGASMHAYRRAITDAIRKFRNVVSKQGHNNNSCIRLELECIRDTYIS